MALLSISSFPGILVSVEYADTTKIPSRIHITSTSSKAVAIRLFVVSGGVRTRVAEITFPGSTTTTWNIPTPQRQALVVDDQGNLQLPLQVETEVLP